MAADPFRRSARDDQPAHRVSSLTLQPRRRHTADRTTAPNTTSSAEPLARLPIRAEDVVGWDAPRIRRLFESYGLVLQEWHKARTDWVTFREETAAPGVELVS
jgi:hypothetical protein